MRFREIMEQMDLRQDHKDAIPGAKRSGVPNTDTGPNNPYHKYRLGVAMAGAIDNLDGMTRDGPAHDDMVMVCYTDHDEAIINAAHKKLGYTNKQLTSRGSTEHDSVNKTSPVPGRKTNKYGI